MLPGDKLLDDDITQLLEVMTLNQKLERLADETYKAANWDYPTQVSFLQTPCATCPLQSECGPTNRVNP